MLIEILEKTSKEIAKEIAKNAAIGGAADGIIGVIDKKNILKEVGCGVVTSGSGTAAREVFNYFIKGQARWGGLIGISASIGTRYMYRKVVDGVDEDNEDEEGGTPVYGKEKRANY